MSNTCLIEIWIPGKRPTSLQRPHTSRERSIQIYILQFMLRYHLRKRYPVNFSNGKIILQYRKVNFTHHNLAIIKQMLVLAMFLTENISHVSYYLNRRTEKWCSVKIIQAFVIISMQRLFTQFGKVEIRIRDEIMLQRLWVQ